MPISPITLSAAYTSTNTEAPITNEDGVQATAIQNVDPDIQLRKKTFTGGGDGVLSWCPRCQSVPSSGNLPGLPVATVLPSSSVPTPSSPIAHHPTANKTGSTDEETEKMMMEGLRKGDTEEVQLLATTPGGMDSLVTVMHHHSLEAIVQENGCHVLLKLARINDNNRVMIASVGGIQAVVSAIQNHPSVANVQEYGIRTLGNLVANDNNKVTIASAGGIQAVVSAMQNHPSVSNVQEYGSGALLSLAANDKNRVTIASAGGIQAVVSAMQKHPSVTDVQYLGCCALANLAVNYKNSVTIEIWL